MDTIVLDAGEGEKLGRFLLKPGFDSYIRELNELRAVGEKPDAELFERHDIYDVDQVTG